MANPWGDSLELPEGCELAVRGDYAFVLNYLKTPAEVNLRRPMAELITGETLCGKATVKPYGVMVLKL